MNIAFRFFAGLAVLAAIYHVVGALGFLQHSISPIWRHLLFVVIDLACAFYLLWRPLIFLPLFALLVAQQSWSHGQALQTHWLNDNRFDLLSALTLIALYLQLGLLVYDAALRQKRLNS